jgi:hypothetical protein
VPGLAGRALLHHDAACLRPRPGQTENVTPVSSLDRIMVALRAARRARVGPWPDPGHYSGTGASRPPRWVPRAAPSSVLGSKHGAGTPRAGTAPRPQTLPITCPASSLTQIQPWGRFHHEM